MLTHLFVCKNEVHFFLRENDCDVTHGLTIRLTWQTFSLGWVIQIYSFEVLRIIYLKFVISVFSKNIVSAKVFWKVMFQFSQPFIKRIKVRHKQTRRVSVGENLCSHGELCTVYTHFQLIQFLPFAAIELFYISSCRQLISMKNTSCLQPCKPASCGGSSWPLPTAEAASLICTFLSIFLAYKLGFSFELMVISY